MSAAVFDALVSVLVEEQQTREALEAENADLRAQLEECCGGEPEPEPPGSDVFRFGYYQQGPSTSKPVEDVYAPQEERWGRTFDHILTFTDDKTWDDIACPSWWQTTFGSDRSRWAPAYGTVVSLPLCPETTADVTAIDPDDVWTYFTQAAQNLVDCGLAQSIVRIGWESQGDWYRWSSIEHPGTYKARFRDAVAAMRSVAGSFLFDWNIAGGKHVDLAAFDPASVDVVSIDLYDAPGSSLSDQLDWLDESWTIAQDNGKLWGVAEWGVWGEDSPDYMRQMTSYLDSHAHAHQAYFDVSSSADHRLANYPQSEAVFAAWAPGARS